MIISYHKRSPAALTPVPSPSHGAPPIKVDRPTKAKDSDHDKPKSRTSRTRTATIVSTAAPTRSSNIAPARSSDAVVAPRASSSYSSTSSPIVKSSSVPTKATTTKAKTSPKPKATSAVHSGTSSGAVAKATQSVSNQPARSSTHAIIGVAAAVGAVVCFAVLLWFVRKWFMKKRTIKAGLWRASVHDKFEKSAHLSTNVTPITEKDVSSLRPLMAINMAETPVTDVLESPRLPPPAGIPDSFRPSSVGSTVVSAPLVIPQSPSIAAMNAVVSSPLAAQSPVGVRRQAAVVTRAFVPTLTDELPVTVGETIFIIEGFDDGWASCTNSSGHCGVVPLECLRNMTRKPSSNEQSSDWRLSQRASSLYSGVRSSGTY